MNSSVQDAVMTATRNEGWIEKIWWKKATSNAAVFLIEFPLILSIPFTLLCFLGGVDRRFLLALAAYPLMRILRWGVRRIFPNLFANAAYIIVCSRGIVISKEEILFLPWSSIVRYSWMSHVGSLTSQMVVEYATANNEVAAVVLDGEEKTHPLGALVDILNARLGS
jgi:hypothetical protein